MQIGKLYKFEHIFDGRLTSNRGFLAKSTDQKSRITWFPNGTIGMFLGFKEKDEIISVFLIGDKTYWISEKYSLKFRQIYDI